MNNKTVKCSETSMELFHMMTMMIMMISKSDTSNNRGTRTISKSFGKYPNNIAGNHINKLQKTAILGTTHIQ